MDEEALLALREQRDRAYDVDSRRREVLGDLEMALAALLRGIRGAYASAPMPDCRGCASPGRNPDHQHIALSGTGKRVKLVVEHWIDHDEPDSAYEVPLRELSRDDRASAFRAIPALLRAVTKWLSDRVDEEERAVDEVEELARSLRTMAERKEQGR